MSDWVPHPVEPGRWHWTGDDPPPRRVAPARLAAPVLFGIDVSRYQTGIDMRRVAAEGISFVIGKVSQGSTYRSPTWPVQRDQARANGMIIAGYHFVDTSPAAAQAANCRAALGDPTTPLALDWETNGGTWGNFMAVLQAFRAAGLNVRLAYAPRWWWQQQGCPDMRACGLPLWSSRYVPGTGTPAELYPRVTADQWTGYGGLSVALVQFSESATVAGMQVDCSAFRGSRDQLAALLAAPSSSGPLGVDPVLQSHDIPPGTGMWHTICPIGRASAYYKTGWISATVLGPRPGAATVWFQSDAAGILDTRWSINFADGHSTRPIAPIPDGCTQIRVGYDFPDGGVICLEVGP